MGPVLLRLWVSDPSRARGERLAGGRAGAPLAAVALCFVADGNGVNPETLDTQIPGWASASRMILVICCLQLILSPQFLHTGN